MSETARTYPALGASVWRVLLRNEWFKATRRLAFLVTFGLFAFIHVMDHGSDLREAMQPIVETQRLFNRSR